MATAPQGSKKSEKRHRKVSTQRNTQRNKANAEKGVSHLEVSVDYATLVVEEGDPAQELETQQQGKRSEQ
jgi:hypothetical protein